MSIWLLMTLMGGIIVATGYILSAKLKLNKHGRQISRSDQTKWEGLDVFYFRKPQLLFWFVVLCVLSFASFFWKSDEFEIHTNEIINIDREVIQLRKGEILPEQKKSETIESKPNPKTEKKSDKIEIKENIPSPIKERNENESSKKGEPIPESGQLGEAEDEILKFVHQFPLFPGCEVGDMDYHARKRCADQKLKNFIQSNLKYPSQAMARATQGTVMVSFVVEKNGRVSDIKVIRDIGDGCGMEAKRVVEMMNHMGAYWTPGMQSGRPVRVQYTLPVEFKSR